MQTDTSFKDNKVKVARGRHGDIRAGSVFQLIQTDLSLQHPNGVLLGIMLAVDDTPLTLQSGAQIGRPLYITTCNQSLESRRQINNHSWRLIALLPTMTHNKTSELETPWKPHATVEFVNQSLRLAVQPLIDHLDTGFVVKQKTYFPRLVTVLCDMKEAWGLWALKHGTCPVCTAKKKDFNNGFLYDEHPSIDLSEAIAEFAQCEDDKAKLRYSAKIKEQYGYCPVLVKPPCTGGSFVLMLYQSALSLLSRQHFMMYIVDLLHQPKKGVFTDLLGALKSFLEHHNLLEIIEARMRDIPRYSGMEHFNKSWFDMSKLTASNYRDMVSHDLP